MPRTVLTVFVALLLTSATQSLDGSNTGSIRGTVIDLRTSQPLAGATVRVFARGSGSPKSTTTAADGGYVFRGLAPGRYGIRGSKEGYTSDSRRPEYEGFSATWLALGEGQSIDNLVLRLAPTGSITGKVTNELEAPMKQVLVEAMRRSLRDGRLSLINSQSAYTDQDGEFRISNLAAGQYVLKATKPRDPGRTASPQVYVPVFYPDAVDPARGQTVNLQLGEELSGIRVTLQRVRGVRLRGVVVNSDHSPVRGANITVSQFGANGIQIEATAQDGGKFEIPGVPAGDCNVQVQWTPARTPERSEMGSATVRVGETDLSMPEIVMYPGATVAGHITLPEGQKVAILRSMALLTPTGESGGTPASSGVGADGAFTFRGVADGRYRLRFSSLPAGYYAGRVDDALIVVSHGRANPVEVRLESGAGKIQGLVYRDNEKQVPAESVTVIVVVTDAGDYSQQDDVRMARTDRTGRFMLQSVPPGSYAVLAFDNVDRGSFTDPEFIQEVVDEGQTVRIDNAGSADLRLTLAASEANR